MLALGSVAFFTSASPARAQDGAEPAVASDPAGAAPEEYERLAQLGFSEFEAGNYAEARSRFADAYQVYPNARVLRALAKCEYELRNYRAAVHGFEAALASTVRPLNPEQRTDAEHRMSDASRYLVRYDIVTHPQAAELTIDGDAATREVDGTYWIPVGDHTVEAHLAGHHSARHVLHVLRGADQKLELLLLPSGEGSERSEVKPLYKKWWVWTTVGVVVAGAAVTPAVLATRDPGTHPFQKTTIGWLANMPNSAAP